MESLVWIGLIVLLLALTAGALHVFLRFRSFSRTYKSFGPALDGTVAELTSSMDRLAAKTDAFEAATSKLDASLERLRRSLARVAVQRAAVQDAQESLARLTAFLPRK